MLIKTLVPWKKGLDDFTPKFSKYGEGYSLLLLAGQRIYQTTGPVDKGAVQFQFEAKFEKPGTTLPIFYYLFLPSGEFTTSWMFIEAELKWKKYDITIFPQQDFIGSELHVMLGGEVRINQPLDDELKAGPVHVANFSLKRP
ncbi:MAG TPA: hypothetical protein VGC62_10080 [Pseudomonas sp.]|uniref:hypothetical protein n=1 Tax=Pseudomonas sp. TaxID=306 RepID=UPI002ED96AE5